MIVYCITGLIEIVLFAGFWVYYGTDPLYGCPCKRYEQGFPIAKSSALLINVNLCVLLLSSNKIWKRWFYYSGKTWKGLHIYIFSWMFVFSTIHTISHIFNFTKTSTDLLKYPVNITGLLLSLIFIVLSIIGIFNISNRIHHILVTLLLVVLSIHGTFCTIKYNFNQCPKATSWLWILPGIVLYVFEYVLKYTKRVCITDTQLITDNILSVELDISDNYLGKIVWINIPNVSLFEWHPFTVCKGSCERPVLFIKKRGDWTTNFIESIESKRQKYILVDGPYKGLPDKFYIDTAVESPCIIICSGIGVTTFLHKLHCQNVYFIIIVKTINETEWIMSLLQNKMCNIIVYVTGLSKTILKDNIQYVKGRPNFENVFDNYLIQNVLSEHKRIDVYFSGSEDVYNKIQQIVKHYDVYNLHYI
jgi:hypothetical protein